MPTTLEFTNQSQLPSPSVQNALRIWSEYQSSHDVADREGQTVGIDPVSGGVWFGSSALDVADLLHSQGVDVPLLFLRVGRDYYWRKGGRR